MRLWHISDLHISKNPVKNQVVALKLGALKDAMGNDDQLIITGDLTDDGHPQQYAQAHALLSSFTGRTILVPGNHDYGPSGIGYIPSCVRSFWSLAAMLGDVSQPCDLGNSRILVLDSCLKTGSPADFSRGEIGAAQLRRLSADIDKAHYAGKKIIVALHHHIYERWVLALKDYQEFLNATWCKADYVLFGHKHEELILKAERTPIESVFHSACDFRANDLTIDKIFSLEL